jgi:lysophospholipase L1-like esterase
LRRVGEVAARQPHLVVVQFGLNDCYMGVDPADFERDLERITLAMLEASACVLLVTSCPVDDEVWMEERVAPFYRAVVDVARKTGVGSAELDKSWKIKEKEYSGTTLYQGDGVHPTDAGHQIMSRGLLELFGL